MSAAAINHDEEDAMVVDEGQVAGGFHGQRVIALARGQQRRLQRAQLLEDMRRGMVDPIGLIYQPPACLETMFTFDFLRAVPGVGYGVVRQLNKHAIMDRVNLAVPLGELTPVRREWLATILPKLQIRRPLALRPQG